MDKLIKLAYIKDGKIHTKDYPANHEKDWELLIKSGLPSFMLSYKNDSHEDRVLLPAQHAAHWNLENFHSFFPKWVKVPVDKWPKSIADNAEKSLRENPSYLGCRFEYWKEADVFWLQHVYWWDKEAGLKVQDAFILDRHGHIFGWAGLD